MTAKPALQQRHCDATTAERLDDAAVSALLAQVDGSWCLDHERQRITREFKFKDFYQTIGFVNAVAWIANREDHHPDLAVGYNRCRVDFTTHKAGGLTENDFICAAHVDALAG